MISGGVKLKKFIVPYVGTTGITKNEQEIN